MRLLFCKFLLAFLFGFFSCNQLDKNRLAATHVNLDLKEIQQRGYLNALGR
jgi:hypothetical protein